MTSKKQFVMYGHNHLFGDLVELITSIDGQLVKVVQNIDESPHDTRPDLRTRLSRLASVHSAGPVDIISLNDHEPHHGDMPIMGFFGLQAANLIDDLNSRFELIFPSLIHQSSQIASSALLSNGSVVNAGAIVASDALIGPHVFINRGATIGHDTQIEAHSIIQPGVNLAGHITISRGATIGIGACVIEDIVIGPGAYVAAGSTVISDVPANTLVAGSPAVVKKELTRNGKT